MKNNNPKISVFIPVYNGEKYLANTINSVINQTYDNWELIILDDESTDNSKKIIEEYASKNNKIKSEEEKSLNKEAHNLVSGFFYFI